MTFSIYVAFCSHHQNSNFKRFFSIQNEISDPLVVSHLVSSAKVTSADLLFYFYRYAYYEHFIYHGIIWTFVYDFLHLAEYS